MVNHKCPFLSQNKFCDIKTYSGLTKTRRRCTHKNPTKCPYYNNSLTKLKKIDSEAPQTHTGAIL